MTAPFPPYDPLLTSSTLIFPDPNVRNKSYPWGGMVLTEYPTYPDSYRPGIIADSTPAGGTNPNWRRRVTSVGLFMASAAFGGLLLQFATVWPLVLTSAVFGLAIIPLMFGERPQ